MPARCFAVNAHAAQVSTQVKWARSSGALPPPDPNDLEPPSRNREEDKWIPEGSTTERRLTPSKMHTALGSALGSGRFMVDSEVENRPYHAARFDGFFVGALLAGVIVSGTIESLQKYSKPISCSRRVQNVLILRSITDEDSSAFVKATDVNANPFVFVPYRSASRSSAPAPPPDLTSHVAQNKHHARAGVKFIPGRGGRSI